MHGRGGPFVVGWHAWQGGMCGKGGGMHGRGACMTREGACTAGVCVAGGGVMHGKGGGVCGKGACMVGGMHVGGHVWQRGMCGGGHAWWGHAWWGACRGSMHGRAVADPGFSRGGGVNPPGGA